MYNVALDVLTISLNRKLVKQGQQVVVGAVDAQTSGAELAAETVAATADAASAAGWRRRQFGWVQVGKQIHRVHHTVRQQLGENKQ